MLWVTSSNPTGGSLVVWPEILFCNSCGNTGKKAAADLCLNDQLYRWFLFAILMSSMYSDWTLNAVVCMYSQNTLKCTYKCLTYMHTMKYGKKKYGPNTDPVWVWDLQPEQLVLVHTLMYTRTNMYIYVYTNKYVHIHVICAIAWVSQVKIHRTYRYIEHIIHIMYNTDTYMYTYWIDQDQDY